MTVAVDTTRLEYLGNGTTTAFFFPWRLLENQDITAWVNHIQRFDILVTGGQTDAGGTVTFSTAPPAGQYVWLIRAIPQTQPYDLHEFDTLSAESQEVAYDRLTLLIQDLQSQVDRCIQFAHTAHITGISNVMPLPGAGQHIAWNFAGNRLVTVPPDTGGGGPGGEISGEGSDSFVAFWTGEHTLSGDGKFLWDNGAKALTVGTVPFGAQKPGNAFMGLIGPTNSTGMQNLLLQTVQGDPSGVGLVTLGDDRVGISSWNFRGLGATNPIYGANFGVVFATDGVANGLEIDVQNDSGTNFQGQALWLNGSTRSSTSAGHRANAILIDTQDGSKWERGILFKEGFVANGATGSIEKMGIHFEQSQDFDFIVIQPRLGTLSNVAVKITNPEFTMNRLEILNSGTIRVSNSMTGPAFPAYSFIESITAGLYLEGPNTLGWAVSSQRRLTLGTGPTGQGLTVWNSGPGADQGGQVALSDSTAVHAVGLMAPDLVFNNYRIRVPAGPGTAGQCLITSGPSGALGSQIETWSYAACGSGGGGGGGTVTNTGVLGLNQLILGDGGVAIKGMGTLGTATTVLHGNASGPPLFAGVGPTDLSATGTANSTTFLRGDWSWQTVSGAGTVTTSGTPLTGQVPFYTGATVISGDPHFKWSNLNKQLSIGLGNDVTSPSQALVVLGRTTGSGDGTMQVWGAYAGASPTLNPPVPLTLIGDFLGGAMPTGFGVTLDLAVHDGVGNAFVAGFLNATAQTLSPTTTAVVLGTQVAGVPTAMLTIDNGGATFVRQVLSRQTAAVQPAGGIFGASKDFTGGAAAANAGLGALIFAGDNIPGVTSGAAQVVGTVDATGGTRVKGRLTFHTSDGTTMNEWVRITSVGAITMAGPLAVGPPVGVDNAIFAASRTTAAGTVRTPLLLRADTTANMVDGHGVGLSFATFDSDNIQRSAGQMFYSRLGADDTYAWHLQSAVGGVLADRLVIDQQGALFYLPTPSFGLVALTANSAQRTSLAFYTNSNAQAVALVAPVSATGNHVWTLPSTFGNANDALITDGAGHLQWASASSGITGTGVSTQLAYFTAAQTLTSSSKLTIETANQVGQTVALRMRAANQFVAAVEGTDPSFAGLTLGGGAASTVFLEWHHGASRDWGLSLDPNNTLTFRQGPNGVSGADRLQLHFNGGLYYIPAASFGFIGLTATGATRTSLSFYTNSNANTVSLIAPASAAGSYVWTLPTTLGTIGQVLSLLDNAGTMGWQAAGSGVTASGAAANQLAFFTGPTSLTSSPNFSFNAGTGVVSLSPPGSFQVGGVPAGSQAAGPLNSTIITPDNANPYQSILGQMVHGTYAPGSLTLANDKVAVAGGAYRGAGGTSPIYGGVFQIGFTTTGVSNAVEVGVLNLTGVNGIGNGVWINGNGNHRDNAILIDTQDSSKWGAGIKFVEGNTGLGATGSILNYGIIFDKSQDQDFIVIRPRVGVTTNRAFRITNPAFSGNVFEIWNDGTINSLGFIQTTGNIGAVQYFASGIGGFTGTKVAGACTMTFTGGLVTNVTGC